jgi:hypothetical protein
LARPRDSVAFDTTDSVTIDHGPRIDLLAVLVIFPTITAMLIGLLRELSPRDFSATYIVSNDFVVTLFLIVLLVAMNLLQSPEELEIRSSGVRTWTRMKGYGREVPWNLLPRFPAGSSRWGS